MKRARLALLMIVGLIAALLPISVAPAGATTGDLVITGVIDGPLTGGVPKAVELYVANNIADLSIFGIGSANNGGGTDGEEFTFPAVSATAGDFIYVASESTGFTSFFGFAPGYTSSAASINGDDAIELFMNGSVVDVFGDIAVDGTGQPWDHVDGWAYRADGTGQDGTTFVLSNWSFSGTDALDGETTNASAASPFPIGTYSATVVDTAPTVASVSPTDGATGVAVDSDVTVTFSEPVTATAPWATLSCTTSGAHTATISGGPTSYTLDPDADFANDETCTGTVLAAQIVDQDGTADAMAADFMWTFTTELGAGVTTLIHDVQGSGFSSPLVGQVVTIEGIVVGDFQDNDGFPSAEYDNGIDGFFVQEEDADADGDLSTSEGIFVSDNDNAVTVGDKVTVTGEVAEFFGLTRLEDVVVTVDSSGNTLPTPGTVGLPITDDGDLERVEGMAVTVPQTLVISEYFNFDRYGEIVLTTDRAAQPTSVYAPGSADQIALADLNARSRITIDDGRSWQNPDPAIHPNGVEFDLTNRFRGGDTVANVVGVMDYAFGLYKIQTTAGADYTSTNPRPAAPAGVGGELTVATLNVLNYYTTIDESGAECFPSMSRSDCRGADNADELMRQRTKIIAALQGIDADVVGLMEIENDAAEAAIADLVSGLNDAVGAGTYDFIATGGNVGTDTIRVALIYKVASVTPLGAHAVLDGVFLDPLDTGEDRNRAVLAQSFTSNANGGVFTVAVNHLKSKGTPCGAPDDDPIQGNCNSTREAGADMLADWLQTDPTGSGDADVLIIGDLNSYDKEDPIVLLESRGYTDLIGRDIGEMAYTYVFSGQWGYLDYVMANGPAVSQVTDTAIWHINADEPDILDYDTSFKQPAQDALYEPNAYRSSDHDPVIVGLSLTVTPRQAKVHSVSELTDALPSGDRGDDRRIERAIASIEDSLDDAHWVDDAHLTDTGHRVFSEEKNAIQDLMRVDGPAEAVAQAAVDALVGADADLAATAISDAIANGGSERYISDAQAQMAEAAEEQIRGRYDLAIDHYRRAWEDAQRALDKAPVRFATFNASLNRSAAGALVSDLSTPDNDQAKVIAEIIQRNRPDVLLVNEFDYDADGVAAELFQDNYLSVPQNGAVAIHYPYRYVASSNTGIPSGFDLDNNGFVGGGNDAFGFGSYEGQYAFVVYSMYPIQYDKVRTFQNFLWKDMPGALLPDDPDTPEPADWYSPEELDVFRLSSKNHVDVPIRANGETVHFLVSHPTPPVFDGDEDRNGTRNFDEIRFWSDYVDGGPTAQYIYDDDGRTGGLSSGAKFVIAGDLNSDPYDGDSIPGAAQQLLDNPRVNTSMTPSSPGGPQQAALQGGANDSHIGDPAFDTADFADWTPGNLRADYVLPSANMGIEDSGVFWPENTDPLFALVGTFPFPSSDHRLVWVDVDTEAHGPG